MTLAASEVKPAPSAEGNPRASMAAPRPGKSTLRVLLSFPVAIFIAFPIHLALAGKQSIPESRCYSIFLGILMGLALICLALQAILAPFRRWLLHMFPILAAGAGALAAGEIITSGLQWLPLPYFPSPPAILFNLFFDRKNIFEHTWHSLVLLLSGYVLGVAVALV